MQKLSQDYVLHVLELWKSIQQTASSFSLIFRTARIHTVTRYFIFTLSVVTFGVFLAARFTDFIPNVFCKPVLQLLSNPLETAFSLSMSCFSFVLGSKIGDGSFAVCSIPSWNCLGCVCSIKKRYQDRRFIRMMVEPDPSFRLLSFHMRIRTCVSFFQ